MRDEETLADAGASADLLELFIRTQRLLHHRFHYRHHREHGPLGDPYRGQGRILALLRMQPEITQKELSYLTDMRPQSLSELLAKLENGGYITRSPDQEDRRAVRIRLTEKGAAAGPPKGGLPGSESLFDCLHAGEREVLAGFLRRVIEDLEEQMEDAGREGESCGGRCERRGRRYGKPDGEFDRGCPGPGRRHPDRDSGDGRKPRQDWRHGYRHCPERGVEWE